MFRIILKRKKLALYLYDDGSPAETGPAGPVVMWVCVLLGSCLSCPGQAPESVLDLTFVLSLFLTLIRPLAKLFTWVEHSFAPCSTVNNIQILKDIYVLFNKEMHSLGFFFYRLY